MMKFKKAYFLSHIINEQTPFYAGKKNIVLKNVKSIKNGNGCNMMHWSFSNHAGTHLDAPAHFIEKGLSVTDFKASDWIFDRVSLAEVINTEPGHIIKPEDIKDIEDCQLLLIKTGFEKYRSEEICWRNSPGLHPQLAAYLREKCPSLKGVGVDFISISNLNNRELGREAHIAFLGDNIFLIEDMKLSGLEKAPDSVIVAPLLVEKTDGSPCTVFAMSEE